MSTYVKTGSWWVSWGAYFWPHSTPNWVPNKVKNLTSKSRTSQNRAVSGPLRTEYSVKYGAVSLIFLISGISLKTDSVLYTFQQYKLHLFIQAFTFVLVPIFAQLFTQLLTLLGVNSWVLKGLITVACMPPPVSSAVILTRAAHGNETAAIFNSVLGSFLGVIITPLSLLFNVSNTLK
jgi:predicted Na+-dependent transporter